MTGGANTTNYTITKNEGTLTVNNRTTPYPITVTANSATYDYDGTEKSASGFQTLTFTVNGHQYTVSGLSASVAKTNAGTYTNTITGTAVVKDANNNNVTAQFNVSKVNGTLTINPKAVTLNCPSGTDVTKTYDGTALHPAATVTGILNNENACVLYSTNNGNNWSSIVPSITDAGTQEVKVSISNPNYTAAACTYTLTVNKKPVTITVADAWKYFGAQDPAFTGSVSPALVNANDLGTITYSRTNSGVEAIGVYNGVLTANYTANGNYQVTVVPGNFEIKVQPEVTITGTLPTLNESGCTASDAPAAYADATALAAALQGEGAGISNPCGGTLSMTHSDEQVPNTSCPIQVTRTYTVSNQCGRSASVEQTININDNTAPVIGDITVPAATPAGNCKYAIPDLESATMAVSSDLCGTVTWVSQSPAKNTPYVQGSSAQPITVTVTVKDACGNPKSETVTVVIPANNLSVTASATTPICLGQSTALSAAPTGGLAPLSYSWSSTSDGHGLPATTNVQNVTATPTTANSKAYTMTVTDDNGCSASDDVTVTVNGLPEVSISPSTAQYVCLNADITEMTVTGANGTIAVTGLPSGVTYSETTGKISGAPTESGNFTVTATVTSTYSPVCTPAATATVSVTVRPAFEAVTASSDQTYCKGAMATALAVTVSTGNSAPTYQW